MPGRHRQSVPPRVVPKRLIAAGASGVVTVLALAPLAHADSPTDDITTSAAPSTDTPTAEAPTSETPTSETPTSETPTSETPTSETPTTETPSTSSASSDAPSSATPSTAAPSTSAPSSPASATTAPVVQRADQAAPNYGTRKITVDVGLVGGDYYPAGTTTEKSMFAIVETGPDVDGGTMTTPCQSDFANPDGGSSCFPFSGYRPMSTSTVTITQTTAAANTVVDPQVFRSVPCVNSADPAFPNVPLCTSESTAASFGDGGLPPVVSDSSQTLTAKQNQPVTISPDSQINRQGAPATSVDVDQPAHGKVTINQAAAPAAITNTPVTRPFTLTYTPATGYAGPDSFRYRVTTANGTSAFVTVSLRVVGSAPTVVGDKDSTTQGDAVRVAVLDNDTTNGGGAVRITGVADPKHGSARISGSSIVYTPTDSFSGTEKFSYTITSYSGTDTASITVKVKADSTDSGSGGAGVDGNSATTSTADTGVPSQSLLEIGGALLVAGAGATIVGRRRRRESV